MEGGDGVKIGVFDIGTNSIHLLIVEIHRDLSYEILGHEKDVTRLGDGSFEGKKELSRQVFFEALDVIDRFAKIARKASVRKIVAVATSAVREAKNGGEFVSAVYERTGVKIQVVTGEEEARLIGLAVRSSIETRGRKVLVIDIGGGSVELVLADRRKDYALESLKLGVARLADRFLRKDPPSKKELRRLEKVAERALQESAGRIRRTGYSMVIGTSGTFINLAAMVYEAREQKPLRLVNHFELLRKDLARLHKRISKMSAEERLGLPGLDPRRADLIVAGSALALVLMRAFKTEKVVISYKNIREGIVLDYIQKNKRKLRAGEENLSIRERSVLQLARRCECDEPHSVQVARLAVALFEKTQRLHRLGRREKELLWFAGILHDVGHYVSFRRHHRHSHYIITNSDLDGFTSEEVEIMGELARSHRKGLAEEAEKRFSKVPKKDRRAVMILSAFLRIADGLDRTHFSVVRSVECRIRPRRIRILARARQDAELEIWQARQRADLLAKVFNRKVEIVGVPERAKRKGG
jgi:exopolyphosphatase/guanosine-5'-triphosphate,3'-diphosphate pyrophosphatase